ncbi:MAG: proliferating cell nuclear antigen (pcna), partial [Candidatus Paceibacterota bacterium]
NIFNNLKNFTDALNMHFSENGLYVQGVDKTHCCLFEFKINHSWFDVYQFDKTADASKIGISTAILHKVLKSRSDSQAININYSGDPDKLSIHFSNCAKATNKTNFNKNVDMPLIDIDETTLSIPPTDYDAEITIGSSMMREIVEELAVFNDKLEITLNEEIINFKSSGTEGEMAITIKNDDIIEYAIIENGNLKQSYSLKFFKLMTGFNKLSNDVKLGFSEGLPMLMLYSLDIDNSDSADSSELNYIKFHLAPYMDD